MLSGTAPAKIYLSVGVPSDHPKRIYCRLYLRNLWREIRSGGGNSVRQLLQFCRYSCLQFIQFGIKFCLPCHDSILHSV